MLNKGLFWPSGSELFHITFGLFTVTGYFELVLDILAFIILNLSQVYF